MTENYSERIENALNDIQKIQTIFRQRYGEECLADKEIEEVLKIAKAEHEEIQQYRAIGTVEECREARERQIQKKPIIKSKKVKIQTGDYVYVKCPCCGEDIFSCFHYMPWNDSQKSHKHCENCGQAIDWSE